jgi:Phytanoyl-CoA dioxygenase (PhyH)
VSTAASVNRAGELAIAGRTVGFDLAITGGGAGEQFQRDGFAIVPDVLSATECDDIAAYTHSSMTERAGARSMLQHDWCALLAHGLRSNRLPTHLLASTWKAVQCTYFEKSAEHNWLVAVHQDLSIPVAEKVAHPDLRAWSFKEGAHFVQPPVCVLEWLVAVRLHLDACAASDGPLRIVPASHRSGVIAPDLAVAARAREVVCVAERGSALVMRPLALHASSKSAGSGLRRVLHFLFGPPELPFGLRWSHAI